MKFTYEQLAEYERRRAARARARAGAREEEQQAPDARPDDHEAGIPEVDSTVHPTFRVSVDLFYSDRRRRDGDGAATTLADCIITARRRLLDRYGVGTHQGPSVRKRE